jgi:phosphatidylinositol-4,5-bisphosphate 3-kinase catalytic subunit alpha/beta/delta
MLIFKDGDDIRQDLLTLQLIRIMDKIWLDNGYDYRMKPYKVLSSLDMVGMIEIVQNSDTTAGIHREMGGTLGALKENTIDQWLRKKCDEENAN